MHMPLCRAFPVLAAFATAAAVHAQTTLYVDASAPPGGNGQSWQTAFRDLQDALAAVTSQDFYAEIRVAQGIYTPDRGTLNRDMAFTMGSAVALFGGYTGLQSANPDNRDPSRFVSVLSGDLRRNDGPNFQNNQDNSRQIIRANNNTFGYIDGFTISAANLDAGEPGSMSRAAVGRSDDCSTCFSNLTIRNSQIVGCSVSGPGAALIDCRFLYLEDTLIAGNRSQTTANGLAGPFIKPDQAYVIRSRIIGNDLAGAPILSFQAPSSDIRSQVIASSVIASNIGSALNIVTTDRVLVEHCTIVDNIAAGGVAIRVAPLARARVTLVNTIISGNRDWFPGSADPQIRVFEPSAFVDYYTFNNLIERGRADVFSPGDPFATLQPTNSGDPRLRASAGPDGIPLTWQDNDYQPRTDSQCVDSADTRFIQFSSTDILSRPAYDLRTVFGFSRGPIRYRDLGAYELTFCPADFDASGAVNIQDVLRFLDFWFGSALGADWNYDSRITPQDLFDFLTAWFQGC